MQHDPQWVRQMQELDDFFARSSPMDSSSLTPRQRMAARRRRAARSEVPVHRRRLRAGLPTWPKPCAGTDLIALYSRLSKTVDVPEASPR